MRSETFDAQTVLAHHDDLLDFAAHGGLLENFSLLDSKTLLNRKLKAIGFKKVPKYFGVGGIGKKRGGNYIGLMGLCERSQSRPPRWTVEVETSASNGDKVNIGAALHEMGHYVEQLCSNTRELKLSYERRGSSFDAACLLVGKVTMERSNEPYVVAGADELIANVNATWIALACGINPVHCAALLAKQSRHISSNTLGDVLWFIPEELARALMTRDFYAKEVESKGWTSELEMCQVMDAATTRLMKRLHKRFRNNKRQVEASQAAEYDLEMAHHSYATLLKFPNSNDIGERAGGLAMDSIGELIAGIYVYPPVILGPEGCYRSQSASERSEVMVTIIKENFGVKPIRQTIHEFLEQHPEMALKIKDVLVKVGL